MYALASRIGIPAIKAVVDDFLLLLRQHPRLATNFNHLANEVRFKERLVQFWDAVLDGKTWQLPMIRGNAGLPFPALFAESHALVFQLFRKAIAHCIPADLAAAWQQRLDILEQSFPQPRLIPASVEKPVNLTVSRCRQLN